MKEDSQFHTHWDFGTTKRKEIEESDCYKILEEKVDDMLKGITN